jgi:hypothetical protein
VKDAFYYGISEGYHHYNFYRSHTKEEPGLKGSEPVWHIQGILSCYDIPVQHTQGGYANTPCQEHTDDAVGSMPGHLTMRSKIGLNYQVDIPNGTCPVMYMDRPCIIRKIAPIIFQDAQLHDNHWEEHPFEEGFILIHLYAFKIFLIISFDV